MELIDRADIEKILSNLWKQDDGHDSEHRIYYNKALQEVQCGLDTLEIKEVNLNDVKTDWSPSKKQMESLHDLLKYNIGVFNHQKFTDVRSLYDDLLEIFFLNSKGYKK